MIVTYTAGIQTGVNGLIVEFNSPENGLSTSREIRVPKLKNGETDQVLLNTIIQNVTVGVRTEFCNCL